MPSIARGQVNDTSLLNWFITVSDVLTDASEVAFRVLDVSAGLPGIQTFPAGPGPSYADVSLTPGHFGVGRYFAVDPATSLGWQVPLTESLGEHRIEWRWKITPTAPYQTGQEAFEVTQYPAGPTAFYITIADVRAAGLPATVADDSSVQAAIELWQAFLERACRQWFYARDLDFYFDGTDSDTIHLGIPIIRVDDLWVNLGTTDANQSPLDPTRYRAYSSMGGVFDDRRNPRIKIIAFEQVRDIFTAPIVQPNTKLKFRKGRQNQRVRGSFGFVEPDGSAPRLIKRALTKLVVEKLATPLYVPPDAADTAPDGLPPIFSGLLTKESTDLHSREYQQTPFRPRAPGLTGITRDQEILDIVRLYRAPIGVATPPHFSAS